VGWKVCREGDALLPATVFKLFVYVVAPYELLALGLFDVPREVNFVVPLGANFKVL